MRCLRVLFLNAGLALGGAEQSLLLLARGLATSGIEPIVGIFGNGPFATRLAAEGIRTIPLPVPLLVRRTTRYRDTAAALLAPVFAGASVIAAARIASLARRLRASVLHTNGMKVHVLGGVAGRLTGIPVIWHLRDFIPGGRTGAVLRLTARWLPSLIVANSESVRADAGSGLAGGPPVIRIYNPVDLARFHSNVSGRAIRTELGVSETTPLVGMVAHLTPWKGHEQFLTVAHQVARAIPATRFVIAGGPIYETDGHHGYAERLAQRARDLGLGDRVAFVGARDDIPALLAALDVLVHCPVAPEPFGRVLAEAMAVARPVVATRAGGIPEVVEDGVHGYLVPPGDTRGFSGAVVRLLEDAKLRKKLGAQGRRHAEAAFDVARHVASVIDAYRSLMEDE